MKHKIVVFDNLGKTMDRYTVGYLDQPGNFGYIECVGMSENPFHPQGYGQHGEMQVPNDAIGDVILFDDLPADCQKCVRQDFEKDAELESCDQDGNPIKEFKVTYARCVIMEKTIYAEHQEAAEALAIDMEKEGKLPGVYPGDLEAPAHVRDIVDDEFIWEVEEQ